MPWSNPCKLRKMVVFIFPRCKRDPSGFRDACNSCSRNQPENRVHRSDDLLNPKNRAARDAHSVENEIHRCIDRTIIVRADSLPSIEPPEILNSRQKGSHVNFNSRTLTSSLMSHNPIAAPSFLHEVSSLAGVP